MSQAVVVLHLFGQAPKIKRCPTETFLSWNSGVVFSLMRLGPMEMMETIEMTRVTSFAAVFRVAHPHPHPNLQVQNGSNATFCLMRGQHRGGTKVSPLLTWLSEPKHKIPGSRARQMVFPGQVVEVIMSYNDWRVWSTYFIVLQNSWHGIATLCFGSGWLTQEQLVGRSAWALHKRILSATIQRIQVLHYI